MDRTGFWKVLEMQGTARSLGPLDLRANLPICIAEGLLF